MSKETTHQFQNQHELLPPGILPVALAQFLDSQRLACVMEATNLGTGYVIKAPTLEIESVRGPVLIHIAHELHKRPAAPVLRTVISLLDKPNSSLRLETFSNLDDEDQRANLEALSGQKDVYLLFYDEALTHRLAKRVGLRYPQLLSRLLDEAAAHRATIADALFDFDRAKAEVMAQTDL